MQKELLVLISLFFTSMLTHEIGTRIHARASVTQANTGIEEVVLILISLLFAWSLLKKSFNITFNHEYAIHNKSDLSNDERRIYARKKCDSAAHIMFNNYAKEATALIKDYSSGFDSAGLQTVIPFKIHDEVLIADTKCPIANRLGIVVRRDYNSKNKCYNIGLKLYSLPLISRVKSKLIGLIYSFISKFTSI